MKNQVQIINQNGKPAFAVLPYADYLELMSRCDEDDTYVPHEVAEMVLLEDASYLTAWRKYLKVSQKTLAERMGVTQAAVSQMEKIGANPHRKTLEKAAEALGITVAQLTDD